MQQGSKLKYKKVSLPIWSGCGRQIYAWSHSGPIFLNRIFKSGRPLKISKKLNELGFIKNF
jgi:hypothetical protein